MPKARSEAYQCDWPGCSGVYKRAEFLERHKRTHLGKLDYRCQICGRSYARSDVLSRHMSLNHGEKPASLGRPRKVACISCVELKERCEGTPPVACVRCRQRGIQCHYRHVRGEKSSSTSTLTSTSASDTSARSTDQPLLTEVLDVPPDGHSAAPQTSHFDSSALEAGQLAHDPGLIAVSQDNPGLAGHGSIGSQAGGGGVAGGGGGGGLEPQQTEPPDFFASLGTYLPGEQPWHQVASNVDDTTEAWLNEVFSFSNSSVDQSLPSWLSGNELLSMDSQALDWAFADTLTQETAWTDFASLQQPVPERTDLVNAEDDEAGDTPSITVGTADSAEWPNVDRGRTPLKSIQFPTAQSASSIQSKGDVRKFRSLGGSRDIGDRARKQFLGMTVQAHSQPFWPSPNLDSFPSPETLSTCMKLYLSNFSRWVPIVDAPRGSFEVDKASPLLLMAMAAIGSVYSKDGYGKLGPPLCELVRRIVVFKCESDRRLVYDITTMQVSLLQTYFALYSGSPTMFQQAESSRATLVSACTRLHLLKSDVSATELLRSLRDAPSQEETERAVKEDHRRLLLGWSIFLFDAQMTCLKALPSSMPLTEITATLPHPDPNARAEQKPLFTRAMADLVESGTLVYDLSDLGYSIIAHTLYRFCVERHCARAFVSQLHESSQNNDLKGSDLDNIHKLLDNLARSLLDDSVELTPLRICCVALAYHSHLQLTRTGFLDEVRIAAGKLVSPSKKAAAQASLINWLAANRIESRIIFAHAAMLRCLMMRFVYDSPIEVILLFDAALCLWACIKFSLEPISTPPTTSQSPETCNDHATLTWTMTPETQKWIEQGGNVAIEGVAELESNSANVLLRGVADRLQVSGWGLAGRYREVLLRLMME